MIKFHQYYVTNGKTKAKCHYSAGNRTDGREAVTIYAREYGRREFNEIFGDLAKNDSDSMTDYFETSRVVIFKDNPLYAAALERALINDKKNQERWSKK